MSPVTEVLCLFLLGVVDYGVSTILGRLYVLLSLVLVLTAMSHFLKQIPYSTFALALYKVAMALSFYHGEELIHVTGIALSIGALSYLAEKRFNAEKVRKVDNKTSDILDSFVKFFADAFLSGLNSLSPSSSYTPRRDARSPNRGYDFDVNIGDILNAFAPAQNNREVPPPATGRADVPPPATRKDNLSSSTSSSPACPVDLGAINRIINNAQKTEESKAD